MDEELKKSLLKRAKGYKYNEVQEEYSVKEDGEIALTKRKVVKKYCPPDSAAFKTYMDMCEENDDVSHYTDEQLAKEKHRLLKELLEQKKNEERTQNECALACNDKSNK